MVQKHDESEKKRQELHEKFANMIQEFADKSKNHQETLAASREDNEQLKRQAEALQVQLHNEQRATQNAKDSLELKDADITRLNCELTIANDKVSQLNETYEIAENHKAAREGMQTKLNEAIEDFQKKFETFEEDSRWLQEEKQDMARKMTEMENNLELKNEHVHDLTKSKYELSGEIATLEELLCVREDMHQWVEDLSGQNEMYRAIKEQLIKELEYVTDYLLSQTERNLSGTRIIGKLK